MEETLVQKVTELATELLESACITEDIGDNGAIFFKEGEGISCYFQDQSGVSPVTPKEARDKLVQLIMGEITKRDVLVFYVCKDNSQVALEKVTLADRELFEPACEQENWELGIPVWVGYDN